MRKRLQILLDDTEYREIQALPRRQRVTVAELVRQALREARSAHPSTMETKLRAISDASQHHFPTTDTQTMLRETAPRYPTPLPPVIPRLREESCVTRG